MSHQAIMKAKFKCNDCKLKICGPCEFAHIKTKVTRHHTIEPLHQLNLLQHSLPGFTKPSVGGTVSSSAETCDLASHPTWKKMKMKILLPLTILTTHLIC